MTTSLRASTFISMKDVNINDPFWNKYINLVKDVVLPYQWEAINDRIEEAEKSHAVQNFKIASGLAEGEFYGFIFQDTDVAKWIEAVGYLLIKTENPQLEAIADEMIDIIGLAQQPDGYLNTYYTIKEPNKRWTNLTEAHELYTAGHMIEAAVSYYKATGKTKLLNIVCRLADCIDHTFGFEVGKIQGYDGHQEIELALVKLYEVTHEERYLKLSKYFIDVRGTNNFFIEESEKRNWSSIWHSGKINVDYAYFQAHKPVREQNVAIGHAVRLLYMLAGMIDIARETNDETLIQASYTLWNNIVNKQMYITGGIGSTVHGEAFTFDYDLPNDTAYAETCASIGLIFAGKRMLECNVNNQFTDVIERALYNTVLSGIALDGKHFFYVNPLEVYPNQCHGKNKNFNHIKTTRPKWYGCACCPPNLARLITSLGDYIYSAVNNIIYVHLFIGSEAAYTYNGREVIISQQSELPWHGKVQYRLKQTNGEFMTIAIRQPSWAKSTTIYINGENYSSASLSDNGYIHISRKWNDEDTVEVHFEMSISRVKSHPSIRANVGKVALQRGPLVYCLEQADNGEQLHQAILPREASLSLDRNEALLGGIVTITANGQSINPADWDSNCLYYDDIAASTINRPLTFIPYFTWANRGEGEMLVWVKESI